MAGPGPDAVIVGGDDGAIGLAVGVMALDGLSVGETGLISGLGAGGIGGLDGLAVGVTAAGLIGLAVGVIGVGCIEGEEDVACGGAAGGMAEVVGAGMTVAGGRAMEVVRGGIATPVGGNDIGP